jgi:hypothetical protein
VTVEDKDSQRDVEEDPERLASIAHYIMMHYAKKESVKKNRKKKYKPKAGQQPGGRIEAFWGER